MAKALLLLIVVASISALQYIGIIVTIDNLETVPLWAVVLATGIVAHSITAVLFTAITGIEQKLEILKLRLRVMKAELSPLKDLVAFMKMTKENEVTSTNEVKISIDPGSPEGDHTDEVTVEVQENGTRIVKEVKIDGVIQKKGPGKGHMKGKKISEETRQKLREKAILREQNKRIQKTVEESNKRKARKVAK